MRARRFVKLSGCPLGACLGRGAGITLACDDGLASHPHDVRDSVVQLNT